jgi:hypothetical protein
MDSRTGDRLTALATKAQILKAGEYAYNFDRGIYYNRQKKKAFSVEFIDDHSSDELERCIREPNREPGWNFYFNSEPSASAKRQLEIVLG